MSEHLIEVPWRDLDTDTLFNLVAEFVTRDGTDYGEAEVSTERKTEQVLAGIRNRQYVILFDTELEQCNIVTMESWRDFLRNGS